MHAFFAVAELLVKNTTRQGGNKRLTLEVAHPVSVIVRPIIHHPT